MLSLSGLTFRTLEDIYTTIAQTLEREDITRALLLEEQDRLVQKALSAQRTLVIVDNLENVSDERVRAFLYHLPGLTKSIIRPLAKMCGEKRKDFHTLARVIQLAQVHSCREQQ